MYTVPQLVRNERRIHPRHDAHGRVRVPGVVLASPTDFQPGQRLQQVFLGGAIRRDERALALTGHENELTPHLGQRFGDIQRVQRVLIQQHGALVLGLHPLVNLSLCPHPPNRGSFLPHVDIPPF
ncbi:hypothetical protein D3C81_1197230 [compost metagenome]